ncbi:hypothetical protein B0O99DRAFT_587790 [Bisporella sp. PMI_857]|nr:hypothetical protein B0O99DRAFT_587790 [Bisporella sp. PMI_857]
MHFQKSLVAFAGLVAFVSANPAANPAPAPTPAAVLPRVPEPQTAQQTSEYVADVVSYLSALATDPAILSLASKFQTDSAALSSFQAAGSSIGSIVEAGETVPANFLDSVPSDARSFFGSVFTAVQSIASENGFAAVKTGSPTTAATDAATVATTKASTGGAMPTGFVGMAGVAAAGFMGVVMAL